MSNGINNLVASLQQAIEERDNRKKSPYDTEAKVIRVVDDIAWVKIPGGVDETPAQITTNAKAGDNVMVRISGGRAWLLGNSTNPPTDDTTANVAVQRADDAGEIAHIAVEAASDAQTAAASAVSYANQAREQADLAQDEATRATGYANNALAGLGTLESVIDTVNWFADHKKSSGDISVNPSKTYYVYDEQTGTLSAVTPEGTENPSEEGWYELDEAISNYVASHVAQTDDGLYVVNLSEGWKVLVSSGAGNYAAGIFLIDPTGGIAQATTANGITFNEDKPFYIGDEDAFIIFDGNGHVQIGGSGVTVGQQSLSNILNQLGASIKVVEYGVGSSPTSHSDISTWSTNTPTWQEGSYIWMRTTTNGLTYTYTCIQGAKGEQGDSGEDAVVLRIDSSRGTVFKNNQVSTVLNVTVYSGPDTITDITALRAKFGAGAYLQWYWLRLDDSDYGIIVSTDHKLSRDGFSLTLTPDEVDVKVTFRCELIV